MTQIDPLEDTGPWSLSELLTLTEPETKMPFDLAPFHTESHKLMDELVRLESEQLAAEPVLVGGSHFNGYGALKTMCAGADPGSFRKYIPNPVMTPGELDIIDDVIFDGCVPIISPTRPSVPSINGMPSSETLINVTNLVDRGHANAQLHYSILHEPTQKGITPAQFRDIYEADMPYIRGYLPNAKRYPIFQLADFADPNATRYPADWLPMDLSLISGIGVDGYDLGGGTYGKSFEELFAPVEAFAAEHGDLTIFVPETNTPDVGQKAPPTASGPGRGEGWKPDWWATSWVHVRDTYKSDGSRRYGSLGSFNSHIGGNAPAAVVGPPAVKAGWYCDTTEASRLAFVWVLGQSQQS